MATTPRPALRSQGNVGYADARIRAQQEADTTGHPRILFRQHVAPHGLLWCTDWLEGRPEDQPAGVEVIFPAGWGGV